MKKAYCIYYFSGTGNTWWVADHISKTLDGLGWKGESISIETTMSSEAASKMQDYDLILFGYPIYGSDLPLPMMDFLKALPDGCMDEKKAGVICTQLLFSGDGAVLPRDILLKKGFDQRWAVHFKMPNNICIPGTPFRYSDNYEDHRKFLDKALGRILKLSLRIDKDEPWIQGDSKFWTFNALMQRKPYRKMFPDLRDDLSSNDRCILCGRCEKICPVDNIFIDEKGVNFKGQCILCVRCYNFCPTQAIQYRKHPHKLKRGVPFRGPVKEFKPENITSRGKPE